MRITFEMLVHQLSKCWEINFKIAGNGLNYLNPPLLYVDKMQIKKNQIYLITKDSLPLLPEFDTCCLIYCGIEPIETYKNRDSGHIFIEPSIHTGQILNQVQAIYALYQEWEEQLQEIISNHHTLQEMLDISSKLLECQFFITDDRLNYLAASSHGNPIANSEFDRYTKEANFQTLMKTIQRMDDDHYKFDFYKINKTEESVEIYIYHINDGPLNLGAFSMHPTKNELQEHDFQLFKILASYIKKKFLRPSQVSEHLLTSLLEELFKGHLTQNTDISKLKMALNYDEGDYFRCIVIQLPEEIVNKFGFYLKQRFQMETPSSIAFLYEENLIGIMNDTKTIWNSERFYQSINTWLGNITFIAGASNRFSNLYKLIHYYIEALSAIQFTDPKTTSIKTFSDCLLPYVLNHSIGELPAENLFPPGLLRVMQYNKSSPVDYLETLQIWLEEGKNDSRAAARLYISRNSFLNRRNRLVSLLEEDLDNPDVRFLLSICVRLAREFTNY